MSKLRAEITYSHRLNSDTGFEKTLNVNELLINQNKENNEIENDHEIIVDDDHEIAVEELDNDSNQLDIEDEFSEYLQDWTDMLKEEELAENDECEEEDNTTTDGVIHPANDNNAKWELISLFKPNLKLPF